MTPEITAYPGYFPDCASCAYAQEAKRAALQFPQGQHDQRMEVEITCDPPQARFNSTSARVAAAVIHVLPFPGGTTVQWAYNQPVQCPVAVDRLLHRDNAV